MSRYRRYYLEGYSYVFITMVTFNRSSILIENIDVLRDAFRKTKQKFDFEIVAICILHDHVHMIIRENELKNFSKIVGSIKKYFSYNVNLRKNKLTESMQKRKESGIWQRRFYDHIIRNDLDFEKHLDYIHYNSFKHYNISPKKWMYSTFEKFVKLGFYNENWCEYKFDDSDWE